MASMMYSPQSLWHILVGKLSNSGTARKKLLEDYESVEISDLKIN